MATAKTCEVWNERCCFQDRWKVKHFFTESRNSCVCLIWMWFLWEFFVAGSNKMFAVSLSRMSLNYFVFSQSIKIEVFNVRLNRHEWLIFLFKTRASLFIGYDFVNKQPFFVAWEWKKCFLTHRLADCDFILFFFKIFCFIFTINVVEAQTSLFVSH